MTDQRSERNRAARRTLKKALNEAHEALKEAAPAEWNAYQEAADAATAASKKGEPSVKPFRTMWAAKKELWTVMKALRTLKKAAPAEWKAYEEAENALGAADALEAALDAADEKKAAEISMALLKIKNGWSIKGLRSERAAKKAEKTLKEAEKELKEAVPLAWKAYEEAAE